MTDDTTGGTYLVTHADADSAVLKDVDSGQVHSLSENPGIERHDVIEATLAPEPPMEVTWRVVAVETRRSLSIVESEEPPTVQERDIATAQGVSELTREPRAGKGEIHVISVPPARTAEAVRDVLDDEGTLTRAARMPEVNRVEVRAEAREEVGVVSVRYLP